MHTALTGIKFPWSLFLEGGKARRRPAGVAYDWLAGECAKNLALARSKRTDPLVA